MGSEHTRIPYAKSLMYGILRKHAVNPLVAGEPPKMEASAAAGWQRPLRSSSCRGGGDLFVTQANHDHVDRLLSGQSRVPWSLDVNSPPLDFSSQTSRKGYKTERNMILENKSSQVLEEIYPMSIRL